MTTTMTTTTTTTMTMTITVTVVMLKLLHSCSTLVTFSTTWNTLIFRTAALPAAAISTYIHCNIKMWFEWSCIRRDRLAIAVWE